VKAVGRIALVALVAIFLGWAFVTPQLRVSPDRPIRPAIGADTPQPSSASGHSTTVNGPQADRQNDESRPEAADSDTDLYGNDVSDAVAEYGLDAAGSLYEMHAPQVELPHLGSPKS
jgi:hypothetical protein